MSDECVPTVFVVDSDVAIRAALDAPLRAAGWQPELISSAEEFLARPRILTPGCLLVELDLPGASGLDLQRLVSDRPELPVIFMSQRTDVPATVRAMKAGASEFLTKPLCEDTLVAAIGAALEASDTALRKGARVQAVEDGYQLLSLREREVMQLVVAGRLNKQVAAELGISEVTVKVHRGRMMRKMQAGSLPGLISMAMLLTGPPPVVRPAPPPLRRCQPFLRSSVAPAHEHRVPAATQHPC